MTKVRFCASKLLIPNPAWDVRETSRRLLSIRAEQEIKLAAEAIMESDGERFENSIGKPAHPGRFGSRQVA
jgi:hypothetical protein